MSFFRLTWRPSLLVKQCKNWSGIALSMIILAILHAPLFNVLDEHRMFTYKRSRITDSLPHDGLAQSLKRCELTHLFCSGSNFVVLTIIFINFTDVSSFTWHISVKMERLWTFNMYYILIIKIIFITYYLFIFTKFNAPIMRFVSHRFHFQYYFIFTILFDIIIFKK